ncbi:MAG: endoribonuclease L-PSP [Aeromonas sobria]
MPGSPDADTACVQARLAHEGYKVEVQLTAAV